MAFVISSLKKKGFMLLLCFSMLSGRVFTQVSICRTDSLSYENYLQMLDEESKIPVSEIPEDENPEHLKEQMAKYRDGDRATYNWRCEGVKRADEYASRYAVDVVRYAGLRKTGANVLEGVFRYFYDMEIRLLEEIGPKKFIHKYIMATPKFAHLNILKEAKLREVMDRDDHIRYFLKYILPVIPRSRGQVVEKDEFKCVHYVRLPLFAQGNLMEWISKNVVYPKDAIQNNWEGKIVIGFTVELDGSLSNVHVIKGGAYSLNVEAVRLMKSAPKFIPAWYPLHQQNVRRDLTVTISFNLQ